jgi:hypothetical protein
LIEKAKRVPDSGRDYMASDAPDSHIGKNLTCLERVLLSAD